MIVKSKVVKVDSSIAIVLVFLITLNEEGLCIDFERSLERCHANRRLNVRRMLMSSSNSKCKNTYNAPASPRGFDHAHTAHIQYV